MIREQDIYETTPTFDDILKTIDIEKVEQRLRSENLSLVDDLQADIELVNAITAFTNCPDDADSDEAIAGWKRLAVFLALLRRRTTARAKDIVQTFTDEYRETKVRELEVGNV